MVGFIWMRIQTRIDRILVIMRINVNNISCSDAKNVASAQCRGSLAGRESGPMVRQKFATLLGSAIALTKKIGHVAECGAITKVVGSA